MEDLWYVAANKILISMGAKMLIGIEIVGDKESYSNLIRY
jgi:hypothetical protein